MYSGKVGSSWLPIWIEKSLGHGRYEAAALPSGKTVKVSADTVRGDGETIEQWQAKHTPKEHDFPVPPPVSGDKPKVQKKVRKPSGLDAVVRVLREACRDEHR